VIANALHLSAHARDGRTVVGGIRTGGLSRASRPFREGAAARVVVSQLGPGLIRGDAFTSGGRVEAGAHLIVAGQMATRVLSGPDPVTSVAEWTVAAGATLELVSEPTLVSAGASFAARTELQLEPGARAVVVELVRREQGASLAISTVVRRAERLALHDALRFVEDDADAGAIGTLAVFGEHAGLAALDQAADACTGVRIGADTLRDGDLLARVIGESVWDVRVALEALRAAAMPSHGCSDRVIA
jgi:urease accessory protein UreH